MRHTLLLLVLLSLNFSAVNAQEGKATSSVSCCTCVPCKSFSSEQAYNDHVCSAHGVGCSTSAGTSNEYHGPNLWEMLNRAKESKAAASADKTQQQLTDAYNANHQGIEFQKTGDWANAVYCYEKALSLSPDDDIIRENLRQAKEVWDKQLAEQKMKQQNEAAAKNMQQSINNYVESLNAPAASTTGLDFDGRNTGNSPNTNNGGLDFISSAPTGSVTTKTSSSAELQFGDPNIVDVRNEPASHSVLATGNAINTVYKDAPPGVSDRIHKGFQAVETKDWKAAKAWFQDALKLDPNNKGIQTFIVLCDYTFEKKEIVKTSNVQKADPYFNMSVDDKYEIDEYFRTRGLSSAPPVSGKVQKYINSVSREDFIKRSNLQMPAKEDVGLMFGDPATNIQLPENKDMEYLFDEIAAPAPYLPGISNPK